MRWWVCTLVLVLHATPAFPASRSIELKELTGKKWRMNFQGLDCQAFFRKDGTYLGTSPDRDDKQRIIWRGIWTLDADNVLRVWEVNLQSGYPSLVRWSVRLVAGRLPQPNRRRFRGVLFRYFDEWQPGSLFYLERLQAER